MTHHDGLALARAEVIPVRVSHRTVWLLIRLIGRDGHTGLGEASLGSRTELPELAGFFQLACASDSIATYQRDGREAAAASLPAATAFSAIEMALWDLHGKRIGRPVYELLGGPLRSSIEAYANINRMTRDRVPDGFAESARAAARAGFRAFKAAPFDGFPPASEGAAAVRAAETLGIDCLFAMRRALGDDASIKVYCHSYFDRDQALRIAATLEAVALDWYEESVPVADVASTRAVRDAISQRTAGGELAFGVAGFAPLLNPPTPAVDVIMPDVMHCGGITEACHIAASAAAAGVSVSPHNACGPVSTAAGLALCAVVPNVESLELQWGEVAWRESLVVPAEQSVDGALRIPDGPGLGITLNETLVAEHLDSVGVQTFAAG